MLTRMALAVVAVPCLVGTAQAQVPCMPYQEALRGFYRAHGELPAYIAVLADGSVLTITVNPETHTWSMFAQPNPDIMCLLATGEDWGAAPPALRDAPKGQGA